MKKRIRLFLLIFIIHMIFIGNTTAKDNISENIQHLVEVIDKLKLEYNDVFYKAIYSIDELRSYSIIQIDKISSIYNNNWLSPNKIVNMLTEKDKQILDQSIADYIDSYGDEKKQTELFMKIRNWCNADFEMTLLTEKMGLPEEKLIRALYKLNPVLVSEITGETVNPVNVNDVKYGEHYFFLCLNNISNMSTNDQLKYYAHLFNQLADLSQN